MNELRLATRLLLSLTGSSRPCTRSTSANQGPMRYADWQFERGHLTLAHYRPFLSRRRSCGQDRAGHRLGAGGKTPYYATLGVKKIYGVDVVPH